MSFKRSFTDGSYYNIPIPATIPVAVNSAELVAEQARSCPPPTIGRPTGSWAIPWSESSGGLDVATIVDASGHSVKMSIDVHTGSMTGDDAAIIWRDWSRGFEISTFETVVPRKTDGTINLRLPIKCKAYSLYYLTSDGLSKQAGGDPRNFGHRGLPGSIAALHPGESFIISRRLKCSLGQPGDSPGPNWPMVGIETPRSGAIPEGATIRYMGPITNFVQQAAHDYGFIIGDTAGNGHSTVKTVQGGVYSAAVLKSLDGTTWNQWVVMELGWRIPAPVVAPAPTPPTTTTPKPPTKRRAKSKS